MSSASEGLAGGGPIEIGEFNPAGNGAFIQGQADAARIERRLTDQVITTGVEAIVGFDTTVYDTNTMAGTGGFVVRRTGWYSLLGQVEWAPNATGTRQARISTATQELGRVNLPNAGGTDATIQQVAALMFLTAGDTPQLLVVQKSGGNLNVIHDVIGLGLTFFAIQLVTL